MDIIHLYFSYKSALAIYMVTHGDTCWKETISMRPVWKVFLKKMYSHKSSNHQVLWFMSGILVHVKGSYDMSHNTWHEPQYLITRAQRVAYLAKNQKICDKAGRSRCSSQYLRRSRSEATSRTSLPVLSQRELVLFDKNYIKLFVYINLIQSLFWT